MTKIQNSYDSKDELKHLNLKRLFTNQKLLLKDMEYFIYEVEDKNKGYECLNNIYVINEVILRKLNGK